MCVFQMATVFVFVFVFFFLSSRSKGRLFEAKFEFLYVLPPIYLLKEKCLSFDFVVVYPAP